MSDLGISSVSLVVGQPGEVGYTEATEVGAADRGDVNFFEQQMAAPPTDPLRDDLVSGASGLSNTLKESKAAFESALKKASETGESNDVLAAARSLSEYSIQTSLVAKAAGKSSQAINKLTSLQ